MTTAPGHRRPSRGASTLVRAAEPRCGGTVVVAVDGPSGAGKTTLTRELRRRLDRPPVIHLDAVYPGWDGLAQTPAILHDRVLAPLARGERAAYQRFDWEAGRFAEEHVVPPAPLLVVEGCGAGALARVRLRLGADLGRGADRGAGTPARSPATARRTGRTGSAGPPPSARCSCRPDPRARRPRRRHARAGGTLDARAGTPARAVPVDERVPRVDGQMAAWLRQRPPRVLPAEALPDDDPRPRGAAAARRSVRARPGGPAGSRSERARPAAPARLLHRPVRSRGGPRLVDRAGPPGPPAAVLRPRRRDHRPRSVLRSAVASGDGGRDRRGHRRLHR